MKIHILVAFLTCATCQCPWAQSYITAMGLRLGDNMGVTVQQRFFPRTTLEGIISSSATRQQGSATLLAQMHQPLISRRFNFYVGGGVSLAWSTTSESGQESLFGIAAVAGGEMTLGRINIACDLQPVYHREAQENPFQTSTAVSLRYVFIKKVKSRRNGGLFQGDDRKKRLKERRIKQRRRQKARKRKERKKAKGKQDRRWQIFNNQEA